MEVQGESRDIQVQLGKKTADLKPSNDVTGRARRCGPTAVEMIGYEIAQLSRPFAASSSD